MVKKTSFSRIFKKLFSNPTFWIMLVLFIGSLLYNCIINKECIKEGFEAKADSFDKDLGSGKKLVLFYADWCGHCKKIHPAWDEAASKVNDGGVKMAKVDCGNKDDSAHNAIAKKYNINGYPTIHTLNNGQIEGEYEGGRSAKDFMDHISTF
jgi:protein disulfide-isomerase-like protein